MVGLVEMGRRTVLLVERRSWVGEEEVGRNHLVAEEAARSRLVVEGHHMAAVVGIGLVVGLRMVVVAGEDNLDEVDMDYEQERRMVVAVVVGILGVDILVEEDGLRNLEVEQENGHHSLVEEVVHGVDSPAEEGTALAEGIGRAEVAGILLLKRSSAPANLGNMGRLTWRVRRVATLRRRGMPCLRGLLQCL